MGRYKGYVDYTIEGVVFKEQSTFLDFYTTIAKQIGVDMNNKTLTIEYKVEESNNEWLYTMTWVSECT